MGGRGGMHHFFTSIFSHVKLVLIVNANFVSERMAFEENRINVYPVKNKSHLLSWQEE